MDLLTPLMPQPTVTAGRTLELNAVAVLVADGEGFRTRPVEALDLTLEGIPGDAHHGFTRRSGGREPWYPRKTEMRSGRQLSIVSVEECAAVAEALAIDRLDPALIGANLLVEGLPHVSFLPPQTRLTFESGATLVVELQNGPCRFAGALLASAHPGRDDIALGFVEAASRRRGVVATVDRAGRIAPGRVRVRLPEQWIYAP